MKTLFSIFFGAGLLGLLNAAYLTYTHYGPIPLKCTILSGCDVVAGSPYAQLFGIPLPVLGLLYYSVALILFGIYRKIGSVRMAVALVLFTGSGLLFSLYLLYLELFVIHALCIYCLVSLVVSIILFVISLFIFRYARILRSSTIFPSGENIQ